MRITFNELPAVNSGDDVTTYQVDTSQPGWRTGLLDSDVSAIETCERLGKVVTMGAMIVHPSETGHEIAEPDYPLADCDHELVARVSDAGDDFTTCNKCGGHWSGAPTTNPEYC